MRVADGPQDFGLQILLAADEIEHLIRHGVEKHPVDREIPALGVFFRTGVRNAVRSPTVQVNSVGTKRGHLDFELIPFRRFRADDFDDAETRSDFDGSAKEFDDFFRPGIAGDIVIGGSETKQFVPHATTRPVRDVPAGREATNDIQCKFPFGHENPPLPF